MTQKTQRLGNTEGAGKRSRRWSITINNWDDTEYMTLDKISTNRVIGKEGEEATKHLQAYVEFENARTFASMRGQVPRAHIEIAKGNRTQNILYCIKEGNYVCTWPVPRPLNIITNLWPWQKEIEDIILSEPDTRTIHWVYGKEGNEGKTQLVKYLVTKYDWVEFSCAQKSADIVTLADPDKTAYLFNFSRSKEGYTPWDALEQLKNGMISDSKLKKKTKNVVMNSPHVICFANWTPDLKKLSQDRWKIIEVRRESEADALPPPQSGPT